MASSELRDYMMSLQAGAQGLSSAREIQEKQRQAALRDQLMQDLPQLAAQPNAAAQIAGRAFQAGDPAALQKLVAGMMAQQTKEQKPGLTEEAVRAAGITDPNRVKAILGSAPELQMQLVGATQKGINEQRQATETERRSRGERSNLFKDFDEAEKKFAEADNELKSAHRLAAQDTQTAYKSIAIKVARLAGEKGPLSNQDLSAYFSPSAFGSITDIANYATGKTTAKLSDEQKKALLGIVNALGEGLAEMKQHEFSRTLSNALAPGVFQDSDEEVQSRLARVNKGLKSPISVSNRKVKIEKQTKIASDSAPLKDQLLTSAGTIKDAAKKAKAISRIASMSDDVLKQNEELIRSQIKAAGGE